MKTLLAGFLLCSLILTYCQGSKLDEDKLLKIVLDGVEPYKHSIRQWFWEISGVTYNNPYANARADFIDCPVCTLALPIVRDWLRSDVAPETIIGVLAIACQLGNLAPDPALCLPTIRSYAESVLYIIQNKPGMPDGDFCGIINPGCNELSPYLESWEIGINSEKPLPKPRKEPLRENRTRIVQFTDLHLDLDYEIGAWANCTFPICCRKDNGFPPEGTTDANVGGLFGHVSCALPLNALEALYDHASNDEDEVTEFVFLTGDYIHSGIWLYGEEENTRHFKEVTEKLHEAFPDAEIFPVVGNHEPGVVNMYPPEEAWDDFNLRWMYEAIAAPFVDQFPPAELERFLKYGYYSMESKNHPELRIVVLNTNICYINNFWLPFDPIDTFGQLQWFARTMDLAEKLKQKVYILGHIHPGSGSCWPAWSKQFNRVIDRYSAIIRGLWYGHSHEQDYKLSFDKDTGLPTTVSYVAGSGTTDGMNSAYNVYYADNNYADNGDDPTWEIVQHETWILNLTESNAKEAAHFQKILDSSLSNNFGFGLKSLAPEEVFQFINEMVCNDTLFGIYESVVYKGYDSPRYTRGHCQDDDRNCRANVLAGLLVSNPGDRTISNQFREHVLNIDCSALNQEDSGASGLAKPSFMFHSFLWVTLSCIYAMHT